MTTLVYATGWEHGLPGLSTNGGGIASAIGGIGISIQGTIKRSGGYAIRMTEDGDGFSNYIIAALGGSPTYLVGSVYFRYETLNSVDADMVYCPVNGGVTMAIKIRAATHKLYARFWGTLDGTETSMVIETGRWYKLDYKFYCGGSPHTIDFRVTDDVGSYEDGVQTSSAQSASYFTTPGIGFTQNNTCDVIYDDWVLSVTSGDYPIPEHAVVGIRPNADGTHNAGTNVIERQDGEDIGTVTAYDLLDENPWSSSSSDYVKQVATGTGNYAEVNFEDITEETILGANAILQYMASDVTADEGGCIVIDEDTTETTIWGSPSSRADYSETSMFYKSAMLPEPAGGWDTAAVNALKARMGYSNNVDSVPYWQALIIEVVYQEGECVTEVVVDVEMIIEVITTTVIGMEG